MAGIMGGESEKEVLQPLGDSGLSAQTAGSCIFKKGGGGKKEERSYTRAEIGRVRQREERISPILT